MSVDSRISAGVLHIAVSGRFDFNQHGEFRELTKLAESGVSRIEIDLAETDYLDSSALGMLLLLRDKLKGDSSAISIRNPKPEVRRILEIANFNKLFKM